MKNIHVLKTDKPSRLLKDLVDGTYQLKKEVLYGNRFELPLNIYITSDEEIKDCWFINLTNNEIGYIKNNIGIQKNAKKIILTTDQDLIKDGVQEIPEYFLVHYIVGNNPIEYVQIKEHLESIDTMKINYELIIPKEEPKQTDEKGNPLTYWGGLEEPKQETQGYICPQTKKQCDDECCVSAEECHIEAPFCIISDCEPSKQETLEEAADKYSKKSNTYVFQESHKRDFIAGAKWQAERMCNHTYIRGK